MMDACPLCGNQAVRHLKLPHTLVRKCRADDCGLEFASPQLDDLELAEAYRTLLYPATYDNWPPMYAGTPDSVLRQVLAQLEARLGALKGLRLLDYGCGRGTLLQIASELGLPAVGIEPDPVAKGIGRAKVGIPVYASLRELSSQQRETKFDLVILWNVIEHLRKPWSELQEIRELLGPSGLLLISTMNTRCLRARIQRERWVIYKHPTHFYYFHRRSLERVLRYGGLQRVQEWKPKISYPHHGSLRRWLYQLSNVFGVSDGLYYLCSTVAEGV